MRFSHRLFGALLLLPLMVVAQSGDKQPKIDAKISPDTVMIGDRFFIDVEIDKDMIQIVEFPSFENNMMNDHVEIIDISSIDTLQEDGRRLKLKRRYTLTSFDEGIYNMEPFPMIYADKNILDTIYSADSLRLVIKTFQIDTLTQQIVDIKKPIDTPITFDEIKGILVWVLIGIVLLAVAYYFVRRYLAAKRKREDQRPDEPFYITALRMMESLKSSNLCASGRYKQHYTQLTDILREYLEYRWEISAMEMTSEEIISNAKSKGVTKEDLNELKTIFSTSDLVKFAKMTPSSEDNIASFNAAYRFIDRTKPMPLELEQDIDETEGNEEIKS